MRATGAAAAGGRTDGESAARAAFRLARIAIGLSLAATLLLLAVTAQAMAAGAWRIDALSNPSALPGAQLQYIVQISNVGDDSLPATTGGNSSNCVPGAPAPADASKCYTVTAAFPVGMRPAAATRISGASCTIDGVARTIVCTVPGNSGSHQVKARAGLQSFREMTFTVDVDPGAAGTLSSTFEVAGPDGAADMTVDSTRISATAPEFGVGEFDGQVSADDAGNAYTQAGGHPYAASTSIEFNATDDPNPLIGTLWPVEAVKDIVVDLPPGFVGSPTAVDECTSDQLADTEGLQAMSTCPATSQVGVTFLRYNGIGSGSIQGPLPVYNMAPPPGVPARFGFNIFGTVVVLDAELRSDDDYGLSIVVRNVPEGLGAQGTTLLLWGVPSDASHDFDRACPGREVPWRSGESCPSGAPSVPFLRNPTSCTAAGVGLPTTIMVDSWQDPGDFKSMSFESHLPPAYPAAPGDWGRPQGPADCGRVPFDPSLSGKPASGAPAGKPAGFSFDLSLPQTDNPDIVGTSDLRTAVVTLPRGVRVNPSSADGLAGCSAAQIGLNSRDDPTCPNASRIGSLTVDTPLLDEVLDGSVYLAAPFDNPFDSLLAIYLVARGPGVILKLPGHISPDPLHDGQLTATFDNQPQLPFSNLHLEFKGGSRAPIVLPKQCGTYTTKSVMTGWSGRVVESDSSFTVDEGCGGGFTPGWEAGTETSSAGKSSPFVLRLTRDDADEELSQLTVDMPAGLTGRIADAVLCDAAAGAAGRCGGGSRVGNVTVGAGAGTNPFYITNGRAHIMEGYGGAPFGLSIVVPAVAGPFDLGTVVVRSQIFVDKHTAELRVVSEPLPTQLEGIPLDVKDVRVTIDRDGFILNPTSCEEKAVGGAIKSTAGTVADVSSRFQAYDCASLALRPKMALRVGGRRRTQRGRSTPLNARLRMPQGGANLRQVRVTLPTVLNARLTVINDACTREEYESGSDACEFARTGSAVAVTPLLRDPLRGGVYFVKNGNPLPDLFVRLRGQVDFDLIGKITIPGSKRLRTTFDMVPDVPVSMFGLRLVAGRDGSVGNAANLCRRSSRRAKAELDFIGQNGKVMQVDRRLRVKGCKKHRAARAKRKRARRALRHGR